MLVLSLLLGCAHQPRLSYVTLDSAAEQRPMTYGLYTPPGWDQTTPLPLVVFLHGGGDDELAIDEHAVVHRTLDAWIAEGRLPPFVMVVPDGTRGFWRNWADGTHRFEDWVLDEVIPDVRARLPLLPEPEGQHLMGISMGGAGTLTMGLDHIDRFASLSVISAPIFGVEQIERFLSGSMWGPMEAIFGAPTHEEIEAHNPFTRAPLLTGKTVYLAAGSVDMASIRPLTAAYHDHLVEIGVPHRYQVFPGGHRWVDWAKVFPVSLCFALKGEACDPGAIPGAYAAYGL